MAPAVPLERRDDAIGGREAVRRASGETDRLYVLHLHAGREQGGLARTGGMTADVHCGDIRLGQHDDRHPGHACEVGVMPDPHTGNGRQCVVHAPLRV